jgi:hypothetical protein
VNQGCSRPDLVEQAIDRLLAFGLFFFPDKYYKLPLLTLRANTNATRDMRPLPLPLPIPVTTAMLSARPGTRLHDARCRFRRLSTLHACMDLGFLHCRIHCLIVRAVCLLVRVRWRGWRGWRVMCLLFPLQMNSFTVVLWTVVAWYVVLG